MLAVTDADNGRSIARVAIGEYPDAAEYDPPPGPLVAFLYNPFRGETLERVVQNLTRHAAQSRTQLWVVYVNPQELDRFIRIGWRIDHEIQRNETLLGVILTPPMISSQSSAVAK